VLIFDISARKRSDSYGSARGSQKEGEGECWKVKEEVWSVNMFEEVWHLELMEGKMSRKIVASSSSLWHSGRAEKRRMNGRCKKHGI